MKLGKYKGEEIEINEDYGECFITIGENEHSFYAHPGFRWADILEKELDDDTIEYIYRSIGKVWTNKADEFRKDQLILELAGIETNDKQQGRIKMKLLTAEDARKLTKPGILNIIIKSIEGGIGRGEYYSYVKFEYGLESEEYNMVEKAVDILRKMGYKADINHYEGMQLFSVNVSW